MGSRRCCSLELEIRVGGSSVGSCSQMSAGADVPGPVWQCHRKAEVSKGVSRVVRDDDTLHRGLLLGVGDVSLLRRLQQASQALRCEVESSILFLCVKEAREKLWSRKISIVLYIFR